MLKSIMKSQTSSTLFSSLFCPPARLERGPSRLITQTGPFCVSALPVFPVNHVLLVCQGSQCTDLTSGIAPTGSVLCGLVFWERGGPFDLDRKPVWEHGTEGSSPATLIITVTVGEM